VWLNDEKRKDIARDVKFVGIVNSSLQAEDYDKLELYEEDDSSRTDVILALKILPSNDQQGEDGEQLDEDSEEEKLGTTLEETRVQKLVREVETDTKDRKQGKTQETVSLYNLCRRY